MPTPPTYYNNYYSPVEHHIHQAHYQTHIPSHELDQTVHPSMHSPHSHISVDPSLQLYYPGYNAYQHTQPINIPQQAHEMNLPSQSAMPTQVTVPSLSPHRSSSSQGSDYAVTPPAEGSISSPTHSIARPAIPTLNGTQYGSRKRPRQENDDDDIASPASEFPEGKVKATRGSR